MMQTGLTPQQLALKRFIAAKIAADGVAPNFPEMCAHLGLASKSGIHRLLTSLEQRGHIERLRGHARAIRLIEEPEITPASALRVVLSRHDLSAACRAELLALAGEA
mgnify:CR=1 FL=1